MALIEQTLSTSATTSGVVDGSQIITRASAGYGAITAACGVQVKRVAATGDYEVLLEAGIIESDGTIAYGEVAKVTQDENAFPVTFTVAYNMRYRFRHVSGVNAEVLLG